MRSLLRRLRPQPSALENVQVQALDAVVSITRLRGALAIYRANEARHRTGPAAENPLEEDFERAMELIDGALVQTIDGLAGLITAVRLHRRGP